MSSGKVETEVKNTPISIDYPKSVSREDKFISIIKSKNRAIKKAELEDAVRDNEGTLADDTITSFYYVIRKMGDRKKNTSSNKHTYYVQPEFLERGKLKEEFLSDKKYWGKLGEDKILEMTRHSWMINE